MQKPPIIGLVCLGFALAISPIGFAADTEPVTAVRDFAVRTWGRANGLPGDSVTAILQTRDGYLWVGTNTKLVRFDGVKFTEIQLPGTDANAPAHITALCEDATGKVWVGTQQDGVFCLDANGSQYYRKGQGLLDGNVTSLASDAEGRVWIGTSAGLNRWDGKALASFTSRDGLGDELVSGVHVARSGAIWITTRTGMYQFKDGRIKLYEFETESQGRHPEYLGAYEDRRGNLWVYGDTYLINLSEDKRFNYFRGADAASVRIWSFCEGRDGRLWIGTSGRGLLCFGDNKSQRVTLSELHWPNDVRAICEDREGNLWLGISGGGLMQLLPQPVQVLRADEGVPPGAVACLAADVAGRVFAGFESGGLFAGEGGRFERFPGEGSVEGQSLVASLCATPDETLWIATLGDGLYGVHNGRKIQLTTLNGLADNSLPAICATPDGAIWAGTRAGILHQVKQGQITTFGREQGLPGTPITVVLSAQGGGLWLGTQDGRVLRKESSSTLSPSSSPGGQSEGEVGTGRESLASKFVEVHHVATAGGSPMAAGQSAILALCEDHRGRLWIGTAGLGLACWTGQRWLTWTTQSGLPDENVHGLMEDAEGDLWLVTGRGIFRASREMIQDALANASPFRSKLVFESKRTADQVPAFGWPRALPSVAPAGGAQKLWFATAEGLIAVDKSGREAHLPVGPLPVYLENILVNGKPISGLGATPRRPASRSQNSEAVRLPTVLESLEFQYTALSFVAPEKLSFRVQLEGVDRDWVPYGAERRARYGPLAYGDYRFRVAASQVDGVWSEVAEPFAFTVPAPLWQTPAAVAVYIFAAIAVVAVTARVVSTRRLRLHLARLEQQRVLERERMRIAQDMHDDIGSKLTKISFLSERAKMALASGNTGLASGVKLENPNPGRVNPEPRTQSLEPRPEHAVASQIESIATTSRELLQTLDEIVWAVNPRNDSLEHLAAYLSHYAAEYFQNTAVQCEMRLPRDLPHHPLSAELRHNLFLAFEEVLNNALKHSGAASVSVEMTANRAGFQIVVTDNGQGFDVTAAQVERPATSSRRGGNGLVNMRQRLAVVGGECVVQSQPGQGTTVSLRIPLGSPAKVKI
ncbi:MAG: two-component regulator propeller domain-containing protein [Verrucomicrobiota bacterium]